jgi:hypothetical protein
MSFRKIKSEYMRWINSNLKDSVLALLGGGELSATVLEDRIQDIRLSILMELGEFAEDNYPRLVRNVKYAHDAQGLWYTRGEVMAVLADIHGETIARRKIERISDKFRGMLPRGLSSRPSPLTAH